MQFNKVFALLLLLSAACESIAQNKYQWKQASAGGYTYKYVTNDPMQTRFYTLKNGMSVILTVNHKEPRVVYRMAVRTGSNNDPKDHTGLAHYLEHLLFKGTDKYGTLDWAKEKPYLDKIDALYEKYGATKDSAARIAIYHQIDSISGVASHFAIANEYDKLMSNLGSQKTNAHTWVEETVYEEDIPSNAVDKFLAIQAERFRNPIFRLFHTELEAVYEEKNRGLDNDGVKVQEAMMSGLFPTHNYGQQTTIGTIEHLKNPSLIAIRNYYNKYYVPNNMGIILSGDFDVDAMIKKVEQAFAYMQAKPVMEYKSAPEKPITAPIVKDIFGPSAENMRICFRTPAASTHDAMVLDLASSVLSNGKAGLFDLNLNKQQKAQGTQAGLQQYKDYGLFIMLGSPKQGQKLEEVKDLLIGQLELLKKGNFDESMIRAIVANSKLDLLQSLDNSTSSAQHLMDAFIKNRCAQWDKEVSYLDDMAKVTKAELVAVVNKYLNDKNYVLIYKRNGTDASIAKVIKPTITPIETNAGKSSDFVKKMEAIAVGDIQPLWLDYDKDIKLSKNGIADVLTVQNNTNELFSLYYQFDMGTWNDKLLPLAASYLQFLSTDKYSAEQISKSFYNIACNFNISTNAEFTTVAITGLQENFDKAVGLFEDILANCKADEAALAALKSRIMKARANAKTNKQSIMQGLISYARYGAKNPFNTAMTDAEIDQLKAADLVNELHNLMQYKHRIMYYGPLADADFKTGIARLHTLPAGFKDYPAKVNFTPAVQSANQLLFTNYDMVQSEIAWVRNDVGYDANKEVVVNVFNNYFGGGMGSVVFQTIRESKALAYSTFASYNTPSKKEYPFYMMAYVGCQADKMNEAIKGMNELLTELPVSEQRFELAKTGFKKDLETQRITKEDIIASYLSAQQKGWKGDFRKDEYAALSTLKLEDVQKMHKEQISGKAYTYCVVASDKKIKLDDLKTIGEVKTVSLEELFGY
ncbi:peptidase M16 [Niastella yeongjuensis]|uniref:Peptidase M16 n=1 Tax=Niastella yeongjuensis TaxID=354355 RepID=A0A1V9F7Y1_9BACT|nr:M16 family metallopeptidase [Niastella yeongjuensis]OQP54523.1 peptidase M16 [Niastella yeongjuensis]SEN97650.1 Predicted Zn-dependent peptidase [Niastella yeongjuensis]